MPHRQPAQEKHTPASLILEGKFKLELKKKLSLTLRYTGGGHNDPPSAIYAVEPSKLIRGAQNFGTIPIS